MRRVFSPHPARAAPRLHGDPGGAETLGALGAGVTPRPEDELRPERGLHGEPGRVVEDEEAAVQTLAQFDPAAGIGAATGAGRDLEPARSETHGVVASDDARAPAFTPGVVKAPTPSPCRCPVKMSR